MRALLKSQRETIACKFSCLFYILMTEIKADIVAKTRKQIQQASSKKNILLVLFAEIMVRYLRT